MKVRMKHMVTGCPVPAFPWILAIIKNVASTRPRMVKTDPILYNTYLRLKSIKYVPVAAQTIESTNVTIKAENTSIGAYLVAM